MDYLIKILLTLKRINMKRFKLYGGSTVKAILSPTTTSLYSCKVFKPSMVSNYYCEKIDGNSIVFHDPIFLAFNQERLSQLGRGCVEAWIKGLNDARNSAIKNLKDKSKLSDNDLIDLCMSRHVQSPCEIQSLLREANNNLDMVNQFISAKQKEAAQAAKAAQAAQAAQSAQAAQTSQNSVTNQ